MFNVVATGHRAVVDYAHIMFAVTAVHGNFTFLRVVVMAVNWTLIAAATRTGDSHHRGGGDLGVHEHERNTAD